MENWLNENLRADHDFCFDVYDISEHQDITDGLKTLIANEILKSFRNPSGLKKQFQSKTKAELANYINTELFSPASGGFDTAVRVGDWGEIFTGLYLVNLKGNNIPFYKIRHKPRNNKSVQTLDLLTFDEANNIINFNEVKTKTTRLQAKKKADGTLASDSEYYLAKKAYDELLTEYSADTPLIYNFITKILYDNEQYDLADQFDQFYKSNECNKKANIFLLFDKKFWKEEVLQYLNTQEINLEHLCVFVVLVKDLRSLIDETYGMTVQIAESIVYDE